jgi:hypothetical protein
MRISSALMPPPPGTYPSINPSPVGPGLDVLERLRDNRRRWHTPLMTGRGDKDGVAAM